MRLIQLFVPGSDREVIRDRLDSMEIAFVFTEANGQRNGTLVHIPVPTGAVDEVLEVLYDTGIDESTYTVVTETNRATIPNLEELSNRYVEGPKGNQGTSNLELRECAADRKPARVSVGSSDRA